MADTEHTSTNADNIHRSNVFAGGMRALLSVALYAGIGTIMGHYIGKWGEETERMGRGMSTLLGRWIGGVGLGSLAAYVSLRAAAEDEMRKDDFSQKNAALEARLKELEHPRPKDTVISQAAEHHGMVSAPALEKAM